MELVSKFWSNGIEDEAENEYSDDDLINKETDKAFTAYVSRSQRKKLKKKKQKKQKSNVGKNRARSSACPSQFS